MMPQSPDQETVTLSTTEKITAEELIERALKIPAVREAIEVENARRPTSYRDPTPNTGTGAQPVPQHDPSFWGHVPKWALGVMVAGPATGATAVGIGYGAKLFFDSITTEGVVMVGVIVGGAVVFVGSLCALVKRIGNAAAQAPTPVTNNFSGDVKIEKNTLVQTEARALSFQRTKIDNGGN
jgi:hypothetical protein